MKKLIYANVKEVSIINDGGEGLEGQEIDLKDTSNENPMPLLWKKKKGTVIVFVAWQIKRCIRILQGKCLSMWKCNQVDFTLMSKDSPWYLATQTKLKNTTKWRLFFPIIIWRGHINCKPGKLCKLANYGSRPHDAHPLAKYGGGGHFALNRPPLDVLIGKIANHPLSLTSVAAVRLPQLHVQECTTMNSSAI